MLDKDDYTLQLAMLIIVIAEDPFLRIKKKIGQTPNLEVEKQHRHNCRGGAPTLVQKKAPFQRKGSRHQIRKEQF